MGAYTLIPIADPPDLLALASADPVAFPYLLESVTAPANQRFDILFAWPGELRILSNLPGYVDGARVAAFLNELDGWLKPDLSESCGLPFCGGWFVYLGYECAAGIEPRLRMPAHQSAFPLAFAQRMHGAIIRDHRDGSCCFVVEEGFQPPPLPLGASAFSEFPDVELSEDPPAAFIAGVATIRAHIAAGDVFQVNLSRAMRADLAQAHACALYRRLRQSNPAPFAGLIQRPEGAVLSSSPERLIEVADRVASTRPIAGTRPRTHGSDETVAAELLTHPKERAEHIMLIDLERNDLGRVCETGSIEVTELMAIERYAHVIHIVSGVRGRLRAEVSPIQALKAVFPGGTITGCPKVRCMQIISAIEQTGRGPYTGSMGYLSRDGRMDFNILIRTMLLSDSKLEFRTGAGIVTDSEADLELAETRAKALGLVNALKTPEMSSRR